MKPRPFKVVADNAVVFHHAYIGLMMWWIPILSNAPFYYGFHVSIVGMLILLDDVYEHLIDENSPLRLFFDEMISPLLGKNDRK